MNDPETIAAIATAQGRGAVGIVRLSGPRAFAIASLIAGRLPQSRHAGLRDFRSINGEICDQGLVLAFPAPNSYTGEDVVELQAHGGPVVLAMLLQHAVHQGARQARPGEFSERAFLNERLDLAQAEAVADLIDAASESAVRAARRTLSGEFSDRVHQIDALLMDLRVFVEGALDFSDEDIDWLADDALADKLGVARQAMDALLAGASQGRRLREGLHVAIVGKPNAGKSTLINALAAHEAAIVSELPGTTRDLLREHILVNDIPINLVDTAGLRSTDDPIESEGIRRAWAAIEQSDLVLYLIDDRLQLDSEDRGFLDRLSQRHAPCVLLTQCDRSGRPPDLLEVERWRAIRLSARTGEGMELLRARLIREAGMDTTRESALGARERHLSALRQASELLRSASEQLTSGGTAELAAEDIRQAQEALGSILGRRTSEDLLGEVFSRFCIGK